MHLFVPRNGIWREVPRRWRWSYLVAVALFAVIGILGCFTGGWPILIFALIYGLTRRRPRSRSSTQGIFPGHRDAVLALKLSR